MKIIDNKRYICSRIIFFFLSYPSFSPGTFQDFFQHRVVFFLNHQNKTRNSQFILMARLLSSKIIVLSIFLFSLNSRIIMIQVIIIVMVSMNLTKQYFFSNFCFQNTKILVCFFEQVQRQLCNVKISVFSSFPNSNCNILLLKFQTCVHNNNSNGINESDKIVLFFEFLFPKHKNTGLFF